MPRKVLLSREFSHTLDRLVALQEEVNGILLYRLQGVYCPIEAIFMTGVGNEGHVQADQQRMDIANEFFRRNPNYNFVKFYTHSRGTIARFGEHYATHFSDGDIQSYEGQLRENPDFIGMVATPKAKLLYGRDNPTLVIVNNSPYAATQRVSQEIEQIAQEMGHSLDTLMARLRA